MSTVGQIEKRTQARIVALLCERLHYDYLGNWIDRADNRNIEPELVRSWLLAQGVSELLVSRALHELEKVAGDSSKSLYDRNAEVYRLLRYGVHVKPEMGENTVTVWLIDYREQLKAMTPPLLEKWQPVLGVRVRDWGVKRMKTKWGTCSIDAGRIWLNLELAKKPLRCLEYIVVHEMVHLLERNHGEQFARLMDQFLPDWASRRVELQRSVLGSENWDY